MRKEKSMSTIGKIVATVAIILSSALTITVTAAFANAPGGAYIQCDGSNSSPVRCTPDGW
jgi:hypothetical protein